MVLTFKMYFKDSKLDVTGDAGNGADGSPLLR
jgi:hypothetical protein